MICHEQMRRTRGSTIFGTSQDEGGIPDPPPVPPNLADAMDPGVILADGSESEEEEEEDPKELVMVDESDNEGENVFGMDTDPEV